MNTKLTLKVKKNLDLSDEELENIITLCSNAFNEDFRPYMKDFTGGTHVLGYYGDTLVSHVLWLNRWLRAGDSTLLKTAFVDAVAVDEAYRKKGFATAMITTLIGEISSYDTGALTSGSPDFYKRLGWQAWLGPVSFQRTDGRITPLNNSTLMVLIFTGTPELDLNTPLTVEWHD